MNDLFKRVYTQRQKLGYRLQKNHDSDLKHLELVLKDNHVNHPFCHEAFDILIYQEVYNNAISGCPRGPSLNVIFDIDSSDYNGFLYRLHPIPGVSWLPFVVESTNTDKKILSKLQRDASATTNNTWLKLSNYADGFISNKRNFSWWTTNNPTISSINYWIRELGLLRDYISPFMLLLKCPLAKVSAHNLAYVPSVIEGFDSVIFQPKPYEQPLKPGITISLNDLPVLRDGANELVLMPVSVELVEFYPLEININEHGVDMSQALLELLLTYYTKL